MITVQEQAQQVEHYVSLSNRYTKQPNSDDMAALTNYMKFNTQSNRIGIRELLYALSNGHNAIISNYEINSFKDIRFVSSSLIMIDIDDDYKVTDPKELLFNQLKDTCAALFYTWSHNIKGNRYRLVFQLDKQITSEQDYKALVEYILKELKLLNLPVDSIKSPTQVVRGGNSKEPLINDLNTFLKVDEWLPKAKAHKEKEHANYIASYDELLENPPTFEQMREMVELIGYIPSGVDRREDWSRVIHALKNSVDMGILTDQEGFELFHIVSGDEARERDWTGLKRSVADYRALINLAKDNGYIHNSYAYAQRKTEPIIPTEIIRDVERKGDKVFLKENVIADLLKRNQRLLIDSPTGSGKTKSTLNAMQELSKDDDVFYLFLAPTRALTEQTAKEHDLPHIKGGINPYSTIRRDYNYNQKVFIVIYDLLDKVLQALDSVTNSNFKVRVVIDEAHQLTNAYSYRQEVIKSIYNLFDDDRVLSLIGLSGTVENIQKDKYEKMFKLDNRNAISPLTDFRVYTYKEIEKTGVSNSGNNLTARLIHNLINGNAKQDKVLLFVNDIKRGEQIKRTLKQYDIKSVTINSESKQSATYREVVEHETFGDDVQVIIATTTLSEGINLQNKLNWACVVLSDGKSKLFDPSTIKQISHRFRNTYRHFILVTRPPNNEDYPSDKRFYIEADFNHRKTVSNNLSEYLNEEHAEDIENTFIASGTESNHGLYLKESNDKPTVEYNTDYLRLRSMQEKEFYYSTYRNAFIKEVSRVIGHQPKSVSCINEELERNGLDLLNLDGEDEDAEVVEDNIERLNNFKTYFNEHVYNAYYHKDDRPTIKHFEKHVHEIKVNAIKNTVKISDTEICYKVCLKVRKPASVKVYYHEIKTLTEVAYFRHIKKDTLEKRIYMNVKRETQGNKYTSKELDNVIYTLSNKIKFKKQSIKKNDVKGVVRMFDKEGTRTADGRMTELKALTIESVADKHGLTTEQVEKSILMYIETLPTKRERNIMYESVKSEYGIEKKTV